jgi:N6-L-threonylcarbamoyladenine synthase
VSGGLILAIESSCDETGIALVESGGRRIASNAVASQVALHAATGGIVPEVAARAHVRWIVPVLDEAWSAAGATWDDVETVAVTFGPGLAGSLLVGINFAKALAWVEDKPLVAVNHLEGHVYAGWLLDPGEEAASRPEPVFPLVAVVVSGGHTFIAEMRDHLTYRLLGQTIDDAAGEAFDKVGRLLGLPYPGGPAIQAAAERATRHDRVFPRAWLGDSYDVSFSGLKTAARRIVDAARAEEGLPVGPTGVPHEDDGRLSEAAVAELAWGFQDSVVDVLATKTIRAAEEIDARSIVLGGGVAANRPLRERIGAEAASRGLPLIVPRPGLCTDNGAMIGAAAARRFAAGERARFDLDARPSLPLARPEPVRSR